jgi:hypothetical protein
VSVEPGFPKIRFAELSDGRNDWVLCNRIVGQLVFTNTSSIVRVAPQIWRPGEFPDRLRSNRSVNREWTRVAQGTGIP